MYAAIGTDGREPMVWGMGLTYEAALAEAKREAEDIDIGPLVVREITEYQAAQIYNGVNDCDTLRIELTPSEIREIAD